MTGRAFTVGVIGLGYVGLSTAACFASRGIKTVGVDVDETKLKGIARGNPSFSERGLPQLLAKAIRKKLLLVSSDYSELADAGLQFITVGTPSAPDGSIDLNNVKSATASIGRVIKGCSGRLSIVVKSTVTPGTTAGLVRTILESSSGKKLGEFGLSSNPEFLREGHAIEDTMNPDRLVIGVADSASKFALSSFYRRFYGKLPRTVWTSPVNAELIKYASNSFLATKITFINEVANLCAKLPGADVSVVAEGMGLDKRISPHSLRAGLGYGGSCIPKDVGALLSVASKAGVELGVIAAANEGNQKQAMVAVELAESLVGDLSGKRISLLGLAFKPDSDDMREAVSLRLVSELEKKGALVVAYDPVAMPNAKRLLGERIEYRESARSCLRGADCCIIVTEWAEFSRLRPNDFGSMRTQNIIDGRNALNSKLFDRMNFKFASVGTGKS